MRRSAGANAGSTASQAAMRSGFPLASTGSSSSYRMASRVAR